MTNQSAKSNPGGDSDDKPLISKKMGAAVLVELLAGAVLGVLAINFEADQGTPVEPDPVPTSGPDEIDTTEDGPVEPPTSEVTSEQEESTPDGLADVDVCDCVCNFDTVDDFDLEPTDCGPGHFKVVEVFHWPSLRSPL